MRVVGLTYRFLTSRATGVVEVRQQLLGVLVHQVRQQLLGVLVHLHPFLGSVAVFHVGFGSVDVEFDFTKFVQVAVIAVVDLAFAETNLAQHFVVTVQQFGNA